MFTEGGRTKTVTLREGEVAQVAAAVEAYRAAQAELQRAADAGIAAFRGRRTRETGGAGCPKHPQQDPGRCDGSPSR